MTDINNVIEMDTFKYKYIDRVNALINQRGEISDDEMKDMPPENDKN